MAEVRQNILYITQDDLYINHELEKLIVRNKEKVLLTIPLHHLSGIVILSHNTLLTPSLMHKCLEKGIMVSYLSTNGRFLGRLEGANSGNVLLRKAQFKKSDDESFSLNLVKTMIAGKLQNSRLNLLRSARDSHNPDSETALRNAAEELVKNLSLLETATTIDSARGHEGNSARTYFSVIDHCIIQQKEDFHFDKRTKRPPRSRINALLSFAYSLFTNDCIAACQAVGLDPFVGFLHKERPGRPCLALDLVEEFRAIADRFVLTLINRKQIQKDDIIEKPGKVYELSPKGRKTFLTSYQQRKLEELTHPYLNTKCTIGELPTIQARILARNIRGESSDYIPFIWK